MKNVKLCLILLLCALSLSYCHQKTQDIALEATKIDSLKLRRIGVGDKRLSLLNAMVLNPDAGKDAMILQTSHNYAHGKVVRFQPSTGRTEYLDLPHSSGAWGGVRTGDDVYLGGHMPGDFYHLKIGDDEITHLPIPRGEGEVHEFVWSVDAGIDGNIYLGTYPDCALLRYKPRDGSYDKLGVMVPGEKYIRHVNAKFEGRIFCGIGSHAQLVEYDLRSGKKTAFLPEKYQSRSFVYYSDRMGDMLVAVVTPEPMILFFDSDTRELLREVALPEGATGIHLSACESFVDMDESFYFSTRPDDHLYRYDYATNTHQLIAQGIGGPFGLANDRYLFCRNYFGTYTIYDVQQNEIVLERSSLFEGAGMDIFALAEGLDGTVVGGSYINQGFFSYDPNADLLTAYGASVQFGGQIRQIVASGEKLIIAHYTHARITEYDPQQPWDPGNRADANPEYITAVGQQQDRFPAAYKGEDGLIYFGTQPEYGVLGGALVIYNPQDRDMEVHRHVVRDQSIFALTGDRKGRIYGGSAISGGIGAHPTANEAKIFCWDMSTKSKVFERTVVSGAAEIWVLQWSPDNKLIGAADSALFVYDIAADEVVYTRQVGAGVIMNIIMSSDGWCYGNTKELLFRFSKDLWIVEEISRRPDPPQFGLGLIKTNNGSIYVGLGAALYELVKMRDTAPAAE